MSGWEVTAQAGHESPAYPLYRDTLLALAANDLGVNRLRLEVRSGVENTRAGQILDYDKLTRLTGE